MLIQQIVVNDENRVRIGHTFPRRAKQLVSKRKAAWIDQNHMEIILMPLETEGIKADKEINKLESQEPAIPAAREKDKSIIKNAYREDDDVVLRSTPIEIIKRSKRRTRELHSAFSIALWSGATILYVSVL